MATFGAMRRGQRQRMRLANAGNVYSGTRAPQPQEASKGHTGELKGRTRDHKGSQEIPLGTCKNPPRTIPRSFWKPPWPPCERLLDPPDSLDSLLPAFPLLPPTRPGTSQRRHSGGLVNPQGKAQRGFSNPPGPQRAARCSGFGGGVV